MNYEEIDGSLKAYFKSLERYKPLSKEQERKLIISYKINHDISARNTLITSNLKYACGEAHKYRDRGITFSELISLANDGLMAALEKFDVEQDVKLISYAKWWINQRMQASIEKNDRLPKSDLPEERNFYEDCDDDEIRTVFNNPSDYDRLIFEEPENESEVQKFIATIMSSLNKREAEIIKLYFGLDRKKAETLEEIGKKYNLTKERVRQILEKALLKLRCESMMVESNYLSK